jgi:uncharacterized membrane protein YphA (DoxX/SURF4 family)
MPQPAEAPIVAPATTPAVWHPVQLIAFRVAFVYLVLFMVPLPEALVGLIGTHLLHLSRAPERLMNGSGDTLFHWVELLTKVLATALAAAGWSLLSRHRREHVRLQAGLRVYLRYLLGFTMGIYGLAKVVGGQFPIPGPGRLLERVGELSPMGLLWTFMGHSPGYCVFTGLAEVLGGALLFYRRTTTLGALIVVGVMANVVALNFSYDVPVKIFSTHLLLIAVFLLLPDLRRLGEVFLWQRSPQLAARAFGRWWRWLKPVVLCVVFAVGVVMSGRIEFGNPGELLGTWDVETFTRNGQVHPPLFTDRTRWRFLAVDQHGEATVRFADDSTDHFEIGGSCGHLTVGLGFRDRELGTLTCRFFDADHGALEGKLEGAELRMTLRRHEGWLLNTRGFHWVNETPFNE